MLTIREINQFSLTLIQYKINQCIFVQIRILTLKFQTWYKIVVKNKYAHNHKQHQKVFCKELCLYFLTGSCS